MTYQFPTAPAQGEIAQLPSGHKYQFNNGRWRVYSGNLPTNVQPVVIQLPPVYATTPPPIQDNPFWLDTANDVLHVKTPDGAGGFTWEVIGGGSVDLASIRAEFAAADAATLAAAKTYTDTKDTAQAAALAAGDAATLTSAQTYTDAREASVRSDMASADTAALNAGKAYTDSREAAIRTDMETADDNLLAASKAYTDAGDVSTLNAGKAYTDAREAVIRSDLSQVNTATLDAAKAYTDTKDTAQAAAFAAADAAGLQSAKDYTDAREVAVRADLVAGDAATLASAQTYTDTRETAIRADMAAGDATTLSAAQAAAEARLQAEKTAILNTTDTKIATAIGSLDMSSQALFAADIAARDALVPSLTKSSFVLVADATADKTVGDGAALYFFNLGDASFYKVAEYESMNFMDMNQPLLAKLGEQDGLLTFKGQLVATVQHDGSEW